MSSTNLTSPNHCGLEILIDASEKADIKEVKILISLKNADNKMRTSFKRAKEEMGYKGIICEMRDDFKSVRCYRNIALVYFDRLVVVRLVDEYIYSVLSALNTTLFTLSRFSKFRIGPSSNIPDWANHKTISVKRIVSNKLSTIVVKPHISIRHI